MLCCRGGPLSNPSLTSCWRVRALGAAVCWSFAAIRVSALLDYAARSADVAAGPDGAEMRVIRGCGVESEAELPFAGLHVLLRSALDHLPALPRTQQDALGAALDCGVPGLMTAFSSA